MAQSSANSLLNSLKGKIWLASGALAFFVCIFGVVSYLLASFIISETFYAVIFPFLLLAVSVMVFGWWLANEVVNPIEKVALLARSLERSATNSLPKTSGSTETDELLYTLHRNSQQVQNIVSLMENVADGNLNVALTPLENSDRLSSSFQKLLAKVSESIHAKQELEKFENAVAHISEEISRVRKGNLNAEITNDFPPTLEISGTLDFLISGLNETVSRVRKNAAAAQTSAAGAQKLIQTVIRDEEYKISEINQLVHQLGEMPRGARRISDELADSLRLTAQSMETVRTGAAAAAENIQHANQLRRQINETAARIGRLSERSQDITKISKTIADLAERTNLVALNASIQSVETPGGNHGFRVLAEEVERLSTRAENSNREISSLNKSIAADIAEVESFLQTTLRLAADLSKCAVATGDSLMNLEKNSGRFLSVQQNLADFSRDQADKSESSIQFFVETTSTFEKSVGELKKSELGVADFSVLLGDIQTAVGGFTIAEATSNFSGDFAARAETAENSQFSPPEYVAE